MARLCPSQSEAVVAETCVEWDVKTNAADSEVVLSDLFKNPSNTHFSEVAGVGHPGVVTA